MTLPPHFQAKGKGEELSEGRREPRGEGLCCGGKRGPNSMLLGLSGPPAPAEMHWAPWVGSGGPEPKCLTFPSYKISISFLHRGPWSVLLFCYSKSCVCGVFIVRLCSDVPQKYCAVSEHCSA